MNKTTKESLIEGEVEYTCLCCGEKTKARYEGTEVEKVMAESVDICGLCYKLNCTGDVEDGHCHKPYYTAGRKEALEEVLEVVEGLYREWDGSAHSAKRAEWFKGYEKGANDALTDIKNHLEQ